MKVFLIVALMMSTCFISVNSFCQNNCHPGRVDIDYDPGPAACYCDHFCQQNGDCCIDFCQFCPQLIDPIYPQCGIVQVQLNNICQASSRAVPNSWCQTYCSYDVNGYCNGVMPHMASVCECHDFNRDMIESVCKSQNPSVPDFWCATYCHINFVNGVKTCSVDAHMSSICQCIL